MSGSESEPDTDIVSEEDIPTIECSSKYQAHEYEPLADVNTEGGEAGEQDCMDDDLPDEDGLTAGVLEQRFEKTLTVDKWCNCGHCRDELLQGSLEYRCCREVKAAIGKIVFDGTIETIQCITQHEDYNALTNQAVLRQVAPLLKRSNGRSYRRHADQDEQEYL